MRGRAQTAAASGTPAPALNQDNRPEASEEDVLLEGFPQVKSSPELTTPRTRMATTDPSESTSLKLVMLLGLGFFLIFSAYNTSQDFSTHLLGNNLGTLSLAVNYAIFSLSALFVADVATQRRKSSSERVRLKYPTNKIRNVSS